jgi:hypothetical protein
MRPKPPVRCGEVEPCQRSGRANARHLLRSPKGATIMARGRASSEVGDATGRLVACLGPPQPEEAAA